MSVQSSFSLQGRNPDVLTCIANQTGVDLTAAVEANLTKKSLRDARRHQDNPKLK